MFHIYLLVILSLTNESAVICSTTVTTQSKNCIVSLSIPQENIKTVCEGGANYQFNQKFRSIDSQLSSLRNKITNINVRLAHTLTGNANGNSATGIPERLLLVEQNVANIKAKLQMLETNTDINNMVNDRQRKKETIRRRNDDTMRDNGNTDERKFARLIRNMIRKELAVINRRKESEQNVQLNQERFRMYQSEKRKNNIDNLLSFINVFDTESDTKSGLKDRLGHMKDDSSSIERHNGIHNNNYAVTKPDSEIGELHSYRKRDLSFGKDDREHITRKFEEIEHDIETLANGISALHENMFESEDIRKQFEYEKTSMENNILQKMKNEYSKVESEMRYIKNQTQIVYKLLQATVKSQKLLQTSVQNINATLKLNNLGIQRNISKINLKMDSLNETLYSDYLDSFSVDEAIATLDMQDTIVFAAEIKKVWPTLIKNMTLLTIQQENVIKVLNSSLKESETGETIYINGQNGLNLEKNNSTSNCFGLCILLIVLTAVVIILLSY